MKEELTTQGLVIGDEDQQEAIEAASGIVVPDEGASDKDAEEFANKIIRRAASLRAVKIDREPSTARRASTNGACLGGGAWAHGRCRQHSQARGQILSSWA